VSVLSTPGREGDASDETLNVRPPGLAAGVELIGSMRGSGYRRAPSLIRRGDGQTLQLTPLLYLVLSEIDGHRGYSDIATAVGAKFGRALTAGDVRKLIEGKLRPLGVLVEPDGTQPAVQRANPLLRLRFRFVISNPEITLRVTAPFAVLFHPLVVVPTLVAFVLICRWLFFEHGMALAAREAFNRPGLLLAVFMVTVLSAGFHEFGHAAGARYGGATPGAIGGGLYLAWPAFYTDVTDSYRLGRAGRLRTDLGGLYFNAFLSVVTFGVWWLTSWDAVLLVIGTQLIQMVRQLPPMVRFDGYHLLADLIGVPDLFHRIKPTMKSLWPTHWRDPEATVLKPWARAIVTLWVLIVVPLMALIVFLTVISLPRLLATAVAGMVRQGGEMGDRLGSGHILAGLAALLALLAIVVPVLGVGVMLATSVRRLTAGIWNATQGRPTRRSLAGVVALGSAAALILAWWPHGNYRQIQPYERGVVQQAFHAPSAAGPTLSEGDRLSATTLWPEASTKLPTADHPALALVLVPRTPGSPTWVFPFDRPTPPRLGDSQALAVNTKNGSTVYDVTFALVWADGNSVQNKNEAYAFASCTGCTTVAVSFQVVVIVGHANVVAPQNLSGALSYNCIECVTQALAMQLVLTLPEQPTAQQVAALEALWNQISAFSNNIQGLSFTQIRTALRGYEKQLTDLIQSFAPSASASSTSVATTAPAGGTAPTSQPTIAKSSAPVSSAAPYPSDSPSPSPTAASTSTGPSPSPTA